MVPPQGDKEFDTLADTGVSVKLPPGTAGQVLPRSSLYTHYRLELVPALLDRDYAVE